MPERILITGGSGFIGSCLARELIAAGGDVHLLLRPEFQNWRLKDLAGRFGIHRADLRDAAAVRRAVEACRPDVVFNLATHGAYPFQTDRGEILTTNLLGTVNLLEALRGRDYKALVHAGSSSEYGHKTTAMCEGDRLEPRSDYAIGKAAATHLCLAEGYKGRPVTVVRIFSAYGPWEGPSRIASHVMSSCLRGEPPQVTAGSQPRDFVFVDDVVRLLRVAADEPTARSQILHAGTGRRQTVRDMVEAIVAHVGGLPPLYGVETTRLDEPTVWQASITRTKQLTGWQPQISLEDGVARMWNWFRAEAALLQAA